MKKRILSLLSLAFIGTTAVAQVSITTPSAPITYDFTNFSGSNDPTDWTTSDQNGNSKWEGQGTGTANKGGKYSFGSGNDGSLGFLPSGSRAIYASISFTNNTGAPITGFDLSYDAEHWRARLNGRNNGWAVDYQIESNGYVPIPSLTYVAPNNVPTGGGPHGSTSLSVTISSIIIDVNETIEIRFFGDNGTGSGSRQGVAIDNFSFTPAGGAGVVAPPSNISAAENFYSIDLNWDQNAANDNVLIVRSDDANFTAPTDNQAYNVGDLIGGDEVIYNGSATSFTDDYLDAFTEYHYTLYSVDGSDEYSTGETVNATTAEGANLEGSTTDDLFFSEYAEGGGDNKWYEIYNGTALAVDMGGYRVQVFNNGNSATPDNELSLPARDLQPDSVYVVANSKANSAILAEADTLNPTTFFNGDDAIVLLSPSGDTLDIIGVVGQDPGSQWAVANDGTKEHTIVRKDTICNGTTDWVASAGTDAASSQWIAYTQNFSDSLGSHYTTGCGISATAALTDADGNFGTATNWGNDSVPSNLDAVIDNNITLDGDYEVDTLVVNSGASLTIPAGFTLTVNGALVNNGTITVENNGSLVQTDDNADMGGEGTFNVDRTYSATDISRYDYWSSPVQGITLGAAFPNANPDDFFSYNTGTYARLKSSTPMDAGIGYTATPNNTGSNPNDPVNETRTFTGDMVNNGVVTANFTTDADGFALVGNPYPSAISLEDFFSANSDLNEVFLWDDRGVWTAPTQDLSAIYPDDTAQTTGGYAQWTTAGGTGAYDSVPNGYVATAQGFMVEMNTTGSNSVVFNNAQRVADTNYQFFKTNQLQRLWLNLYSPDGPQQVLVAMHPQATAGFDRRLDGFKLKSGPYAFYSLNNNGDEFAIQAVAPFQGTAQQPKRIPLGIDAATAGNYGFRLHELDNWDSDQAIYLLDQQNGAMTELSKEDYLVELTQTGTINNRFFLIIYPAADQGLGIEQAGATDLFWYGEENGIVLQESGTYDAVEVQIISLGGNVVRRQALESAAQRHYLNTGALAKGVYLLQTADQNGQTRNFKIMIK